MKNSAHRNKKPNQYRTVVICSHFLLLIILLVIALTVNFYARLLIAFMPTIVQASTALSNKFQLKTIKRLGWLEIAHTFVFILILAIVL